MRYELTNSVGARAPLAFPFYLLISTLVLLAICASQVSAFPLNFTIEDMAANWTPHAQPVTNDPNYDPWTLNSIRGLTGSQINPPFFNLFSPADVLTFPMGGSEGLLAPTDDPLVNNLDTLMGIAYQNGIVQATKDSITGAVWNYRAPTDPTNPETARYYRFGFGRSDNSNDDRMGFVVAKRDSDGVEKILYQDETAHLLSFHRYEMKVDRTPALPNGFHIMIDDLTASVNVIDQVVLDNFGPLLGGGAPGIYADNGFDWQWSQITVVPEPNTFAMAGMGTLMFAFVAYRHRSRRRRFAYELVK